MSDYAAFYPGEEIRIPLEVRDVAGVLRDPGEAVLRVKSPSGTVVDRRAAVVRDDLGLYHADLLLDAPGVWWWRWETTAPYTGAIEDSLTVRASKVL
jgi:hypothetical protein